MIFRQRPPVLRGIILASGAMYGVSDISESADIYPSVLAFCPSFSVLIKSPLLCRFFPRWKQWETRQAFELDFSLDDAQLTEDWTGLLNLASQPGSALEQIHIFCLAHVLRRPIVVYGVKYVKSWRGENLGYARFEGEHKEKQKISFYLDKKSFARRINFISQRRESERASQRYLMELSSGRFVSLVGGKLHGASLSRFPEIFRSPALPALHREDVAAAQRPRDLWPAAGS